MGSVLLFRLVGWRLGIEVEVELLWLGGLWLCGRELVGLSSLLWRGQGRRNGGSFVFADRSTVKSSHILETMVETRVEIDCSRLLLFLLLSAPPLLPSLALMGTMVALSVGSGPRRRALRVQAVDLLLSRLVAAIQVRLDLLISLCLPDGRLQVIIRLLSLLLQLLKRPFTLRVVIIKFTTATWTSRGTTCTVTFLALTVHHLKVHGRCTALISCRRCNHFVHIAAKLMDGERIVALVFVLPCERIFALFLLPQDLEHGAIEEQIEAVTHGLDADALTMDVHLINEALLLSILVE